MSDKVNFSDVFLKIIEAYDSGNISNISFKVDAELVNEKIEKYKLENSQLVIENDDLKKCNDNCQTHILELENKLFIAVKALKLVQYKHPECFCMDQVAIVSKAIKEIEEYK